MSELARHHCENSLEDLLGFAEDLARSAGALLRDRFGRNVSVQLKKDQSYVSSADLESHRLLVAKITECFPDHGILSEEEDGSSVDSIFISTHSLPKYIWVLDPLDGTSNFLHGLLYFNVTLGCLRIVSRKPLNYEILVGVVYNPMSDELYSSARGLGVKKSTLGKRSEPLPILSKREAILDKAFIACGFRSDPPIIGYERAYLELLHRAEGTRRQGSAALDLVMTAEGKFDVFFDAHAKIWDVIAGMLFIQELGGVCHSFPHYAHTAEPQDVRRCLEGGGVIGGARGVAEELWTFFDERLRVPQNGSS